MHSNNNPDRTSQHATASDQAQLTQVARDQYNTTTVVGPGGGPAPQALAALPAAGDLVGRAERTAELLDVLDPSGPGAGVVVVTGLAGIGKTALALHTAHQAVSRGWFPGGTLFVQLRGYDPTGAVSGQQALAGLLRALGIRDDDLPPTDEERENLYRTQLARRAQNGPILILADDASETAQLRPLVPSHPEHRLLATSRDALTSPDLPARLIGLVQLEAQPAADLIADVLTRVRPGDLRLNQESRSLGEVAALCGYLPLALTIAAAQLVADPGLPLTTLAGDLANAHTRLKALSYQETDGRSLGMQAAFDLSYRRLDDQLARLFRLLSINPGPDLSTETAAVLAYHPVRATRQSLAALARAGLISEQPIGSDRWRMHDLTRLYADEQCQHYDTPDTTPTRKQALSRLLQHYRVTTHAANSHLTGRPGQSAPDRFQDRDAALAWLDAEHFNLTATIALTATTSHHDATTSLAGNLAPYLHQRHYLHESLATAQHALRSAHKFGDLYAERTALSNLGTALREMRQFEEAIDAHTQAINIGRRLNDRHTEGTALNNLGAALREMRRFEEAIDAHTQAINIFRGLNDRHAESMALNNLGAALREMRRFEEAIDAHTQAINIGRRLNDRHAESMALNNLGAALREMRRFEEAIDAYTQAINIGRGLNDRHAEGMALTNLGSVLWDIRRFEEAIDALTQAINIGRGLNDRHAEGMALTNLGLALREMRRFEEAIDALTQAINIFRELNDRHTEGMALTNLGSALWEIRQFEEAIDALTQAINIFRELNDRHAEGMALNNLGLALQQVGRFEEAIDAHTQAINIGRGLNDRHAEGMALNNLGLALQEVGRFEEAIDAHTQAINIGRGLNNRHTEGTALNNLGLALQEVGRFEEAIDAHTQAINIFRELNNRHAESMALDNLGAARREVRRSCRLRALWIKLTSRS
ncbi:tetratricopeptide repeat protein [Streptomyces sp. NPDC051985]|uniref:tetratricopeptide repeat protein n=1 Tax=Streptomyces sp. NPDC051985 TaxID=3155807 RepID=UPI003430EA74